MHKGETIGARGATNHKINWASPNAQALREGMRDGMPIALGYLTVAFSLGIAARNAGLTVFQALLASLLNNASAGEYAGFTLIASQAAYWEVALITLIANARYLLMGCSLSQKFAPGAPLCHRMLIAYDMTDELFGIAVARSGYLNPYYSYGAMMVAMPCWALGTALGVVVGNLLPFRLISAFGMALYGLFLAVIIPPARKNKVVAGLIALSFAASYGAARISFLSAMSSGTRTILLTVLLSAAAALFFPVRQQREAASNAA